MFECLAFKLEFYKDMSKYLDVLNIDINEQLGLVVKMPKLEKY